MEFQGNGELIPVGGGDAIPLIRPVLTIGRRESCDICLRYANISNLHCELSFRNGHWFIADMDSTNGIRVNNLRVPRKTRKVLHPKDTITIAKRQFIIEYEPFGQNTLDELLEEQEEIFDQPLLERAGLVHRRDDEDLRPAAPEPVYADEGAEADNEDPENPPSETNPA